METHSIIILSHRTELLHRLPVHKWALELLDEISPPSALEMKVCWVLKHHFVSQHEMIVMGEEIWIVVASSLMHRAKSCSSGSSAISHRRAEDDIRVKIIIMKRKMGLLRGKTSLSCQGSYRFPADLQFGWFFHWKHFAEVERGCWCCFTDLLNFDLFTIVYIFISLWFAPWKTWACFQVMLFHHHHITANSEPALH